MSMTYRIQKFGKNLMRSCIKKYLVDWKARCLLDCLALKMFVILLPFLILKTKGFPKRSLYCNILQVAQQTVWWLPSTMTYILKG